MSLPTTYLKMLSTATSEGQLRMELVEKPMPDPKPNQVIVKVEATPINPSDHGVMFGLANIADAISSGSGSNTILSAPVPPQGMKAMMARLDQPLPVGNEGAGSSLPRGTMTSHKV